MPVRASVTCTVAPGATKSFELSGARFAAVHRRLRSDSKEEHALQNLGPYAAWLAMTASVALLLLGIVLLRLRWRGAGRHSLYGGWLLVVAGIVALSQVLGAEIGIAAGLLIASAAAYLVITFGIELREQKLRGSRVLAPEPEDRPTNWPRAIAKSFLAIVVAGIAAIGIGVAFAVAMPLAPQDRIVIGGLLVPLLWGAGMAWTLSDAKLVRATLLLALISLTAYGVAFLPKLLTT